MVKAVKDEKTRYEGTKSGGHLTVTYTSPCGLTMPPCGHEACGDKLVKSMFDGALDVADRLFVLTHLYAEKVLDGDDKFGDELATLYKAMNEVITEAAHKANPNG